MNAKLQQLSTRTMILIGEFAVKNDVEAIKRLSDAATRIKSLQDSLAAIEHDATELESFLNGFTKSPDGAAPIFSLPETQPELNEDEDGSRSRGKKILIEIHWERLGKPGGKEVICEHKASDTMAKFLHRLYNALGTGALEKLSTFRVSIGPLVSKDPRGEFANRAKGTLYSHQRLPGTPFYVLTHSQTSQKVGDLKDACKFLGLPIGAVFVSETEKHAPVF
jgi:hypothetical protein